jgi:DNA-binding CsgD family transcriptional regulator
MVQELVRIHSDIDVTIDEMRRFALGSLSASAAIFYWIDESAQMQDVVLSGVPAEHFARYRNGMRDFDPLNIARLTNAQKRIAMLYADYELAPLSQFSHYRSFLHESAIVDVMDLVFWHADAPIAGLGILKTRQDPPFGEDAMRFANAMQPYIEFNLRAHPRLKGMQLRRALVNDCGLTLREMDVTELVRCGYTNLDIAEELGISLGTVKTHLIRIFEKLGVENRTTLALRLNYLETDTTQPRHAARADAVTELR